MRTKEEKIVCDFCGKEETRQIEPRLYGGRSLGWGWFDLQYTEAGCASFAPSVSKEFCSRKCLLDFLVKEEETKV